MRKNFFRCQVSGAVGVADDTSSWWCVHTKNSGVTLTGTFAWVHPFFVSSTETGLRAKLMIWQHARQGERDPFLLHTTSSLLNIPIRAPIGYSLYDWIFFKCWYCKNAVSFQCVFQRSTVFWFLFACFFFEKERLLDSWNISIWSALWMSKT